MDIELPYQWREKNPGKHRMGIYGQQHADGWHCWGCGWMNSDASITKGEAMEEHGTDFEWKDNQKP